MEIPRVGSHENLCAYPYLELVKQVFNTACRCFGTITLSNIATSAASWTELRWFRHSLLVMGDAKGSKPGSCIHVGELWTVSSSVLSCLAVWRALPLYHDILPPLSIHSDAMGIYP